MKIKHHLKKLMVALLSLTLIFSNANITVFANEEENGETSETLLVISSLSSLDESILNQQVEVGSTVDAINLPSSINAAVISDSDEQTSDISVDLNWTIDATNSSLDIFNSDSEGNTFTYVSSLANSEFQLGEGITLPSIVITVIAKQDNNENGEDVIPTAEPTVLPEDLPQEGEEKSEVELELEALIEQLPTLEEMTSIMEDEEKYMEVLALLEQIEELADENDIDLTQYDKYMALMGDPEDVELLDGSSVTLPGLSGYSYNALLYNTSGVYYAVTATLYQDINDSITFTNKTGSGTTLNSIILDLNGHTITAPSGKSAISFTSSCSSMMFIIVDTKSDSATTANLGVTGTGTPSNTGLIDLTNVANFYVTNGVIKGRQGTADHPTGETAVYCGRSSTGLLIGNGARYTELVGGAGYDSTDGNGGNGGYGLYTNSTSVTISSHAYITGGIGGSSVSGNGGTGGDAVYVNSSGSLSINNGSTVTGGAGGSSVTGTGGNGGSAVTKTGGTTTLATNATVSGGTGGNSSNGKGGNGGDAIKQTTGKIDADSTTAVSGGNGGDGGQGGGSGGTTVSGGATHDLKGTTQEGAKGAKITITDSEGQFVKECNTVEEALQDLADGSTIKLEDDVTTDNGANISQSEITVDLNGNNLTNSETSVNPTLTVSGSVTLKDSTTSQDGSISSTNSVKAVKVTSSGSLIVESGRIESLEVEDGGSVSLKGGTFGFDPSAYLPDDSGSGTKHQVVAVESNGSTTYKVVEVDKDFNPEVSVSSFEELKNALENEAVTKVTVTRNISFSSDITVKGNKQLDLNGNTLAVNTGSNGGTKTSYKINVGTSIQPATLTIDGENSGNISALNSTAIYVPSGSTFNLNDNSSIYNIQSQYSIANPLISVDGTMNMSNGNVYTNNNNGSLSSIHVGNSGQLNISGGSVHADYNGNYCITTQGSATVNITDGNFESRPGAEIYPKSGTPNITVSGGKFNHDFTSTSGYTANLKSWLAENTMTKDLGSSVGYYRYEVVESNYVEVENEDGTTTKYASLKDALAKASDGDTIKLFNDTTLSDSIACEITNKKVTLDLNGYDATITTNPIIVGNNGELTIIDSSKDKSGTLSISNSDLIKVTTGGTLNIEDGTLSTSGSKTNTINAVGGSVNVSGGTLKATNQSANSANASNVIKGSDGAQISITGGSLDSTSSSTNYNNVVNVTGSDTKVSVNDVTLTSSAGYGFYGANGATIDIVKAEATSTTGAVLYITDSGTSAYIHPQAKDDVTLESTTGSAAYTLYAGSGASLKIDDGNFAHSGTNTKNTNLISSNNATVEINDGYYSLTGGSGISADVYGTGNNNSITINGGEFVTGYSSSVAVYGNSGSVTITDGKFRGSTASNASSSVTFGSSANVKISGGEFAYNKNIESKLVKGYTLEANEDATYKYKVNGDPNVTLTINGETSTYPSIEAALEFASDGATITLNEDVNLANVKINSDITLDLNGHKITQSGSIDINDGVTFTLKDNSDDNSGVIDSSSRIFTVGNSASASEGANLIIDGGNLNCNATDSGEAIKVYGANANVTVNDGTVRGNGTNVESITIDSQAKGSSVTVNGGTLSSEKSNVISGGNTSKDATVTINGGTLASDTSDLISNTGFVVTISDGNFNAIDNKGVISNVDNVTAITGGQYSNNVNLLTESGGFITDGYKLIETKSGDTYKYEVVAGSGNKWIADNQEIIDKEAITKDDITAINTALSAYELLDSQDKALEAVVAAKANLDNKMQGATWASEHDDIISKTDSYYGKTASEIEAELTLVTNAENAYDGKDEAVQGDTKLNEEQRSFVRAQGLDLIAKHDALVYLNRYASTIGEVIDSSNLSNINVLGTQITFAINEYENLLSTTTGIHDKDACSYIDGGYVDDERKLVSDVLTILNNQKATIDILKHVDSSNPENSYDVTSILSKNINSLTSDEKAQLVKAGSAYTNASDDVKGYIDSTISDKLVAAGAYDTWMNTKVSEGSEVTYGSLLDKQTVTGSDYQAIDAALTAYNALSDTAKALVGSDVGTKLQAMKDAAQWYSDYSSSTNNAIGKENISASDKENINSAVNAFKNLSESAQGYISDEIINIDDETVTGSLKDKLNAATFLDTYKDEIDSNKVVTFDKDTIETTKTKISAAKDEFTNLSSAAQKYVDSTTTGQDETLSGDVIKTLNDKYALADFLNTNKADIDTANNDGELSETLTSNYASFKEEHSDSIKYLDGTTSDILQQSENINNFNSTYAAVLSLTKVDDSSLDHVNTYDPGINDALDAYSKLGSKSQASLSTAKSKLDNMNSAANWYKDNKDIITKGLSTEDKTITVDDKQAIDNAYNALSKLSDSDTTDKEGNVIISAKGYLSDEVKDAISNMKKAVDFLSTTVDSNTTYNDIINSGSVSITKDGKVSPSASQIETISDAYTQLATVSDELTTTSASNDVISYIDSNANATKDGESGNIVVTSDTQTKLDHLSDAISFLSNGTWKAQLTKSPLASSDLESLESAFTSYNQLSDDVKTLLPESVNDLMEQVSLVESWIDTNTDNGILSKNKVDDSDLSTIKDALKLEVSVEDGQGGTTKVTIDEAVKPLISDKVNALIDKQAASSWYSDNKDAIDATGHLDKDIAQDIIDASNALDKLTDKQKAYLDDGVKESLSDKEDAAQFIVNNDSVLEDGTNVGDSVVIKSPVTGSDIEALNNLKSDSFLSTQGDSDYVDKDTIKENVEDALVAANFIKDNNLEELLSKTDDQLTQEDIDKLSAINEELNSTVTDESGKEVPKYSDNVKSYIGDSVTGQLQNNSIKKAGIEIEQYKQDSIDSYEDYIQQAKDDIDALEDLTDTQKETYKSQLDGNSVTSIIDNIKGIGSEISGNSYDEVNYGTVLTMQNIDKEKEKGIDIIDSIVDGAKSTQDSNIANAKQTAKDELDAKAMQEKQKINDSSSLTQEQKDEAIAKIDTSLSDSKANIDKQTSIKDVNSAKDEAIENIDDISVDALLAENINAEKESLKQDVKEKQDAIDQLGGLTDQQKEDAKQQLQDQLDNYLEQLDEVDSASDLKDVVNEAESNINKSYDDVTNTSEENIDKLITSIQEEMDKQTSHIDSLTGLTDQEKENAKQAIKDSGELAISQIEVADNYDDVQSAYDNANNSIDSTVDKYDKTSAVNNAKAEVEDAANQAIKDVNNSLSNLTDQEKQGYLDEIEESKNKALEDISKIDVNDQSTSVDDINDQLKGIVNNAENEIIKQEVIAKLNDTKTGKDNIIDNSNGLTDQEKADYKQQVDEAIDQAIDKINNLGNDIDSSQLEKEVSDILNSTKDNVNDTVDKAREQSQNQLGDQANKGVVSDTTESVGQNTVYSDDSNKQTTVTIVDNSQKALEKEILTDNDIIKVDSGSNVDIWLEVNQPDNSDQTQKEISVVTNEFDEIDISGTQKKYQSESIIDISMFKRVITDGVAGSKESVSRTDEPVTIKLTVPQADINTDSNYARVYKIIRAHSEDGDIETAVIDCNYDASSQTITFKSDRFSIYSLVYIDTPVQKKNDASSSKKHSSSSTSTYTQESVDTTCGVGMVYSYKKNGCVYKVSNTDTK